MQLRTIRDLASIVTNAGEAEIQGIEIELVGRPSEGLELTAAFAFTDAEFTDYFDDVSTVYLDNTSFTDPIAQSLADRGPEISEELRPAGAKRGSADFNDTYFILNIRAEYYLPPTFNLFKKDKLMTKRRKKSYRRKPYRR